MRWLVYFLPCCVSINTWCQLREDDSCKGQKHKLMGQWWLDRGCPWRPWSESTSFSAVMNFIDWDMDGHTDVLEGSGDLQETEIVWFKQILADYAATTFSEKTSLLNWTAGFDSFAAADWNGDGLIDLLICSQHVVLFMMNDGDSFHFERNISNVSSCQYLKAVDFDSDGDLDLIVDNVYFERISELGVEERIGRANPLKIQKNDQLWAVEDFDNDGDLDLVVERSFSGGSSFHYIEQLSDGSFREPNENPFHGMSSVSSRYIGKARNYLADLNGDGLLDLWQMGSWRDCHYVYERRHLVDRALVEHAVSENPTNPFLDLDFMGDEAHYVDWNQDGLMDLVLSRAHCNGVDAWDVIASYFGSGQSCYWRGKEPAIRYFQGQEDGSLKPSFGVFDGIDPEPRSKYRISIADWDQDGDLDLILISRANIRLYENRGGKVVHSNDSAVLEIGDLHLRWTDDENAQASDFGDRLEGVSSQPILLDWDGDGLMDLIIAPEGRFFQRQRNASLIELPPGESPFRTLPVEAASDLQWRFVDCDADGDLDLVRLNRSHRPEACERQGDILNCSSNFACLQWEEGEPDIYAFDVWAEDGFLSFLGTPVSKDHRAKFWSRGFCLPSQQCNGNGRCRNLRGVCECIQGYDLNDCSGCRAGFASVDGKCQACAADERGVTCSGRGLCHDDHFARSRSNISNSTRLRVRGDGSCICNEETFGGTDTNGKVNCQFGRCPAGSEEVWLSDASSGHCQPCSAGSSSADGSPCSVCMPGTAAGAGSGSCDSCLAGQFSSTAGNSECSLCHAGTYSTPGSSICSRCSAGSFSGMGAGSCAVCPAGSVADSGSPSCVPCTAGTYAHEGRFCRACPRDTIAGVGSTECQPCVGAFLVAHADSQSLSCQQSMLNLFFAAAMVACLTVALNLTAWLCFYQLHIEDLTLQGDRLVVTTSRAHRLLYWQRSKAVVTLRDTGCPPLEGLQKESSYRAKALTGRDLQLIHKEILGTWDTSIGYLRIHFFSALLHTGLLRVPSLVWLILLYAAVAFLAPELLLRMLLVVIALALVISFLVYICFYRMSRWTPLALKRRRFRQQLHLARQGASTRSESGPDRAITIGQVGWLLEFFQSFIKNRSMYYICPNLVKPLTEDCKLSYAELVGPNKVNWFVSHFWGGPFQEFVNALQHHAKSDGAVEWQRTAYWICTFSNNQWEVEQELGQGDWRKSSFYKALRSDPCKGTAMVLDDQAQPLRRAWCLFEILQTQLMLTERGSSFKGLLFCTSSGVLRNGQGGIDIAMAVANCLATLDLKDARASDADDERMIHTLVEQMPGGFHATNSFVRRSIRDCLLVTHENFEADFGRLLTILNSDLLSEDYALPTLLPKPRAAQDTAQQKGM